MLATASAQVCVPLGHSSLYLFYYYYYYYHHHHHHRRRRRRRRRPHRLVASDWFLSGNGDGVRVDASLVPRGSGKLRRFYFDVSRRRGRRSSGDFRRNDRTRSDGGEMTGQTGGGAGWGGPVELVQS